MNSMQLAALDKLAQTDLPALSPTDDLLPPVYSKLPPATDLPPALPPVE